jgi:hypothetical protein
LPFWNKRKADAARHGLNEQKQCAKDIALAASFVRSLESGDHDVNLELERLAGRLERLAGQVGTGTSAKAA